MERLEPLVAVRIPRLRSFVERHIARRFQSLIQADDVLQDIWLAVFEKSDRFEMNGERALDAWLWRIARYRLNDVLRRARREKRGGDRRHAKAAHGLLRSNFDLLYQLVGTAKTPSGEVAKKEAALVVNAAMDELTEQQRVALALYYHQGRSRSAIARKTGGTLAGVNALSYRGLRKLRKIVGPRENLLDSRG